MSSKRDIISNYSLKRSPLFSFSWPYLVKLLFLLVLSSTLIIRTSQHQYDWIDEVLNDFDRELDKNLDLETKPTHSRHRAISKDDESMYSHHRHSHYHKMDNQDHAHVSLSYRFLSRGRRDSNRPPQRYCGNRLITSLNGVCAGKGHQGMGCPDKADIRSIRQRRDEKRSVTDRCCKNACSYRQLKEMCCS